MIRECYTRLRESVIWGYILVLPLLDSKECNAQYTEIIQRMIGCLRKDDLEVLASEWQTMMISKAEKIPKIGEIKGYPH